MVGNQEALRVAPLRHASRVGVAESLTLQLQVSERKG